MSKIYNNKEKGITLIALLVTIIVLIILSAISINIVFKGDLFGKAQNVISKANAESINSSKQQENVKSDWDNLPGESIKSPTAEGPTEGEIVEENAKPIILLNELSSKTTTTLQIVAKATDTDEDVLNYSLFISTSQNGTYTKKADKTAVTQNTQTILEATGLSNYTTYWWYITVNDGQETITSDKQTAKTYCPGTGVAGNTCTTSECQGYSMGIITCTTCNGAGTTSQKCAGGSSIKCTVCKGSAKVDCTSNSFSKVNTMKGGGSNPTWTCPSCKTVWEGEAGQVHVVYGWKCTVCSKTTSYYCSSCYNSKKPDSCNGRMTCTNCNGGYTTVNTCMHGEHGVCSEMITEICTTCDGNKTITGQVACSHGQTVAHRYCEHYKNTTLTSHEYCSHGYTSQH